MKSKFNITLAYCSVCFVFLSHKFAFSAEETTLNQSKLILRNIETKLNEIVKDRNSRDEKYHISNKFILNELKDTNKYLLQISEILQNYMRNENQAQARNYEHMMKMEDEVNKIKNLILDKQNKISMK